MLAKKNNILNKNSRLMLYGFSVSQICGEIFKFAFSIYFLSYYDSLILFSGYISLEYLFNLLLGTVIGNFCDNHSRKNIMAFSDFFRGILMIVVLFLFIKGNCFWLIFVLVSLIDPIPYLFFYYASYGLVKEITETESELVLLNSRISLVKKFSVALGSLVAAMITTVSNYYMLIIIIFNIASFLISAYFETKINSKSYIRTNKRRVRDSLKNTIFMIKEDFRLQVLIILLICINSIYGLTIDVFLTYKLTVNDYILQLSYVKTAITVSGILTSIYLTRKTMDFEDFRITFILFLLLIPINLLLILPITTNMVVIIILYCFVLGMISIKSALLSSTYIINACNVSNVSSSFAIIQTILTLFVPFTSLFGSVLIEKYLSIYLFILFILMLMVVILYFKYQKHIKKVCS